LNVDTALQLYKFLFTSRHSINTVPELDDLYAEILQYQYGHRAGEVHPFILEQMNPLHMLVKLNIVLLGSPVIAPKLIGSIRYLQNLRAICAVVAFECLGRALDRTTLQASTLRKQMAMIVQAALLLDQVVEMNEDLPAAAVSIAQGDLYARMRRHLIQYISSYLQKLISSTFGHQDVFFRCIRDTQHNEHLADTFWVKLSELMPGLGLQKPPRLRKYGDMKWSTCGSESGQALHEFFSSQCSIKCN
jgi:hypothetical protein